MEGEGFEIDDISNEEKTRKRLYLAWKNMIYRCDRPHNKAYKDYGGRGITIAKEWYDFDAFFNWAISNDYNDSLSLERVDNDGNYIPENCMWATDYEQGLNKRNVRSITINGETKNAYEWCKVYNINYNTFLNRNKTLGWDVVKSLVTPVQKRKNPKGFSMRVRPIGG